MMMDERLLRLIAEREVFERDFDAACRAAERHIAMSDVGDLVEDEELDLMEERFHCEVCTLNGILTIIEPVLDRYLSFLEGALGMTDTPEEAHGE